MREADTSKPIVEVCREGNLSEQTFHRWKRQFGQMEIHEARRLKELEREKNTELKKFHGLVFSVFIEKWRRRIGIEPTRDSCEPHTGFEDQERHQTPVTSSHHNPSKKAEVAGKVNSGFWKVLENSNILRNRKNEWKTFAFILGEYTLPALPQTIVNTLLTNNLPGWHGN